MSLDYIHESLMNGMMGIPLGVVVGYALAKAEDIYRRNRKAPRDHS